MKNAVRWLNRTNIIILAVIGALLTPAIGHSEYEEFPYYIMEAARAFELKPALLYSVCLVESRCRAKAVNKFDSTKDKSTGKRKYNPSRGLFQLKLGTARALGYTGTAEGLFDPEVNAFYAAKLFKQNLIKYRNHMKAISAHNAGRYISSNIDYVNKVLHHYTYLTLDRGLN